MRNEERLTLTEIGKKITPPQTIVISFAFLIILGALLLNLPIASKSGESIGLLNALFTSTSAVCVTGLVVVNTMAHWTVFGKIVILVLIQFGALGLMTILTLAMVAMRKTISLRDRMVIQASYNQSDIGGMVRLVKSVFLYTAVLESAGAIVLSCSFYFSGSMTFHEAVYKGIFHSISAFCNAGFDIIGTESLTPYRSNVPINLTIMILIVAGGIGFTVLAELHHFMLNREQKSFRTRLSRLSLHTKIALTVTGMLLFSGTGLFLLLEWSNPATLGPLSCSEKLGAALFQSVTLRTAGFNTIDQGSMTEASQFISCLYMMIGGSPAGTAGGMKTVSFGVIVISMISVLKGRSRIEAFGRTLPLDMLQKALTVACTMLIAVVGSTLFLCFSEQGITFEHSFLDLLFESASAAGTVGISTGLTPFLSTAGRCVIIVCMFLGRLSPVTVVVALSAKLHATNNSAKYLEERVIIG